MNPNIKKIKPNYIIIPLITIMVAILGGIASQNGMDWYDHNIIKPALTPPKWIFPIAWNLIFITSTAAALILWNKLPHQATTLKKILITLFRKSDKKAIKFKTIFGLFILNAILNVLWSWLFFANHKILAALMEMIALEATLLAIMFLTWKESKLANILLAPYIIWVGFATFLTFQILQLNS